MLLIDASVVVYSIGRDHGYRAPAVALMERVRAGEIDVNVSTEVLQEVLNVYHRRGELARGLALFDDLITQFSAPLPITKQTLVSARGILERHPTLDSRDAVHAATVFEFALDGIISTDQAFDMIDGLRRFDPKELAA
jgi:predicted nucleic acid-binding protein